MALPNIAKLLYLERFAKTQHNDELMRVELVDTNTGEVLAWHDDSMPEAYRSTFWENAFRKLSENKG